MSQLLIVEGILRDAAARVRLAYAEPAEVTTADISLRTLIRWRRLREEYFEAELFADPAWDILLDLAAARLDGKQVSVTDACIAAAVPHTTALRWLNVLTSRGLIERVTDDKDGRRVNVRLTNHGWRRIRAFLKRIGISVHEPEEQKEQG